MPDVLGPVGFIGLGAMGLPMCRNLVAAGYDVAVWNRTAARAAGVVAEGARLGRSPADLSRTCAVVLTMLPDLPEVESVLDGPDGLLAGGDTLDLLVVLGTVSPVDVARLADRLATDGVQLVDAPVSGGVEGAEAGSLSIMAGGDHAAVARLQPLFDAMGTTVRHLGPVGSGSLAKACNQMVVAATLTTLAEAAVLARHGGLDLNAFFDVLEGGLAASQVLRTKRDKFLAGDYAVTGAARFLHKDLGFALTAAREHGVATPSAALSEQLYGIIRSIGLGGQDTAVVHRLIAQLSGD